MLLCFLACLLLVKENSSGVFKFRNISSRPLKFSKAFFTKTCLFKNVAIPGHFSIYALSVSNKQYIFYNKFI